MKFSQVADLGLLPTPALSSPAPARSQALSACTTLRTGARELLRGGDSEELHRPIAAPTNNSDRQFAASRLSMRRAAGPGRTAAVCFSQLKGLQKRGSADV